MNRKFAYGIVAAAVASTVSVLAEETPAAKTLEERIAALETSAKQSSWADKIKIKGDLRYRFEDRDSNDSGISDKSRHRLRARIGAYGAVNDQVDFAVRLATGTQSATSTNQDIDGYGNKKDIWLDLAYMTLNCKMIDGLSATFGKMEQPWETVSDLVFDTDLNPEGASAAYKLPIEQIDIRLNAGHFIMDENTSDDIQITSGQIAANAKLFEGASLTAGLNTYIWNNAQDAVVGDGNTGAVDFEIVEGFSQVELSETPLPIKIFGDYAQNMASGISEDTAWMVGVGTKIGKLSLDYNFRDIEPDSIYGNLADSDFHDGGTGGRGHKIGAKYDLMKNLSTGITYFITKTDAGNDVNTLQLDLAAKF